MAASVKARRADMEKEQELAEQPSGIAERAMEQARGGADMYFNFLKRAIADTPSGGNEFAESLKGYAETSITTTQEYLRQLSQARNFQDIVRIQTDFIQSLMNAAGEQTRSMAGAFIKTASDAAKNPLSDTSWFFHGRRK
jgi:hypothetical protein